MDEVNIILFSVSVPVDAIRSGDVSETLSVRVNESSTSDREAKRILNSGL